MSALFYPRLKNSIETSLIAMWAWTGKPSISLLLKQLDELEKAGYRQFMIYPRYGLKIDYLSKSWFELVKSVVTKAASKRMKVWLYDEFCWPSGTAKGMVMKNCQKFQSRHLFLINLPAGNYNLTNLLKEFVSGTKFIGIFDDGKLYRVEGKTLTLIKPTSALFNIPNPEYVDLFNPEAICKFIQLTHEQYMKVVGRYFGKTILGIFTDEPSPVYTSKTGCFNSRSKASERYSILGIFPWSQVWDERFQELCGPSLKEAAWDLLQGKEKERRFYFQTMAEQLETSFFAPIGNWCKKHNLSFTGHLFYEKPINKLIWANGSFYQLTRHQQVPGLDETASYASLNTPGTGFLTSKLVEGTAAVIGRKKTIVELFALGPCSLTPKNMAEMISFELALGINQFLLAVCPYNLAGNAIQPRYFSTLFRQQPWFDCAKTFSRWVEVASSLALQGKAKPDVLFIHPVQSLWSRVNPYKGTLETKENYYIQESLKFFLKNQVDVLVIEECLLDNAVITKGKIRIGKIESNTLVLPPIQRWREQTSRIISQFLEQKGRVIVLTSPEYPLNFGHPKIASFNLFPETEFYESVFRKQFKNLFRIKIQTQFQQDRHNIIVRRRVLPSGELYWLHNASGKNLSSVRIDFSSLRVWEADLEKKKWTNIDAINSFYQGEGKAFFVANKGAVVFLERKNKAKTYSIPLIRDWQILLNHPNACKIKQWKWQKKSKNLSASFCIPKGIQVKMIAIPECVTPISLNGRTLSAEKREYETWIDDFYYILHLKQPLLQGSHILKIKASVSEPRYLPYAVLLGKFAVKEGKLMPLTQLSLGDIKKQGLEEYWGKICYRTVIPPISVAKNFILKLDVRGAGTVKVILDKKEVGIQFREPWEYQLPALNQKSGQTLELEFSPSLGLFMGAEPWRHSSEINGIGVYSAFLKYTTC